MDETAVYFDTHANCIVNPKGAKTVSVRQGSSCNKRSTVCIAVASDGSKLSLFVIFKVAVNGPIATSLPQIMPAGMHGCTQPKGWMYNRVMQLWMEKIWLPYSHGSSSSGLLLDRMESHIHPDFIDAVDSVGTNVIHIPRGFTSVCQPCDFGIMRPFKARLAELCQDWKVAEYERIGGTGKIPLSGRDEVLDWLDLIWREFSNQTIKNSFKKCGFTNDLDIDIDVALDLI